MLYNNTAPFLFLPNHVIGAFSYPHLESQKRFAPEFHSSFHLVAPHIVRAVVLRLLLTTPPAYVLNLCNRASNGCETRSMRAKVYTSPFFERKLYMEYLLLHNLIYEPSFLTTAWRLLPSWRFHCKKINFKYFTRNKGSTYHLIFEIYIYLYT